MNPTISENRRKQEKITFRMDHFRKVSGKFLINLIIYALLIELVFVFLYPLIYLVFNSLKYDFELIDASKVWVITRVNAENYSNVFQKMNYFHTLFNTLTVVLISTVGHVLSCGLAGYGFARFQFRGKGIMFGIAMLSLIIPPQVLIMPLYIQYSELNWMGTFLPILVPCFFGFGLKGGLYIFLFRQFFKTLPKSYEEAAKIEGCSMPRIFFSIMLPIAKTTILVVSILSVVWHWNDAFEPDTYLSNYNRMLVQRISGVAQYGVKVTTALGNEINLDAMAACVLAMLPLMVIYFVFQKQFMQGVENSGLANF